MVPWIGFAEANSLGIQPAVGADTDRGRKDPSRQAAHGPPRAVAAE
jgi:hypothetical protein